VKTIRTQISDQLYITGIGDGPDTSFDASPSPDGLPAANDLRAWVERYWLCGWVVVPLGPNRTPLSPWSHYRAPDDYPSEYDKDTVRWDRDQTWHRRAHGVGMLPEFSRAVCVDVDVPIEDAQAHLATVLGVEIPDADLAHAVVRTRSGRCHLWYSWPDGPPPNLSVEQAAALGCPSVEIKGQGQCVPLPPSKTGDGAYTWHRPPIPRAPEITEGLPPAPRWVRELAGETS